MRDYLLLVSLSWWGGAGLLGVGAMVPLAPSNYLPTSDYRLMLVLACSFRIPKTLLGTVVRKKGARLMGLKDEDGGIDG